MVNLVTNFTLTLCLKFGAGEGWRRSVEPIVRRIKKYYIRSRNRGISNEKKEGWLNWLHLG
jgi:spore cortex formation protein SpoVR/YcgB (stage V sporulation)